MVDLRRLRPCSHTIARSRWRIGGVRQPAVGNAGQRGFGTPRQELVDHVKELVDLVEVLRAEGAGMSVRMTPGHDAGRRLDATSTTSSGKELLVPDKSGFGLAGGLGSVSRPRCESTGLGLERFGWARRCSRPIPRRAWTRSSGHETLDHPFHARDRRRRTRRGGLWQQRRGLGHERCRLEHRVRVGRERRRDRCAGPTPPARRGTAPPSRRAARSCVSRHARRSGLRSSRRRPTPGRRPGSSTRTSAS